MFDHLLSDYRLFFEGMPAPVFYKSFYPMGCETDGQWEMLRYAQGLKADKDPERCHFDKFFDTYKRDVCDLLVDVSADFPGRKVGVVAIPSSEAGNVNRVTKLLRCVLVWADDQCADLTGCLVRCESKRGAHEGGSRSVAANVSTLRFNGAEKLEDIDVLLVVDDILTSGKSFRAVDGVVRSAGFSGTIVNFAFSRTMPGVCIDEYVRFAYGERAAGRRCETFNSLVLDLDQTLIDDAAKDDDYEEGLWGGGGATRLCPYSIYSEAAGLTALGVPYAVISNRPKRELDAIFRDLSVSDALYHKGACEAGIREGDWWGARLKLARLARNRTSRMPLTDNVFGPPRSDDHYKKWIYKPNPRGVKEALDWLSSETLKGERARAIGLGNTSEDMLAYRAAGITAVLALWGVPSWCREHAAENWGADCVFESPSDFADWFKGRCEPAPMPDFYRLGVEAEDKGELAVGFYAAAVEYGVSVPQAAAKLAADTAPDERVRSVRLLEKRLARGDFLDSALALARLLAGANPDRARVLYGMAAGAGSVDAARELSSLVQAEDPGWAVLLLELAYELGESDADLASDLEPLVKQGVESAISLYEGKLVEANLRSPVALAALISESDSERAKAICERTIAAGDERWATYLLALLVQSNDPERAKRLYERAIAAGDEYYATNNLANLVRKDDPERAEALYERAIAAGNVAGAADDLADLVSGEDPERAEALYGRAIAAGNERYATRSLADLVQTDDPERAKGLYERAIAAGDEFYAANSLAALVQTDDPDRAKALYERAIAAGDEFYATRNLANLVKSNDPDRAEALYERAIAAGNVADAADDLALLVEPKDPVRAEALYERAIAAGDERWATDHLANLIRKDDPECAEALYERAIAAGNERWAANSLGWLIREEDPERAKGLYERAIAAGNEDAATNNLALLVRADDPERAESLFERAIAAGDEFYATRNLANLVKSDDPERAEALFERAIAAGNVADAAYDLALLLEPNDPERSKSLYERAIAAGDERWAANSLANLICKDDPERAEALYERAIAAGNEDAATNNLANLICKDDPERAESLFERAIAAGDEYATNGLGCLICKDDPDRARSLYERAMAAGDERYAPCNLAHMLIASDPERAKALYEGALAYGEAEAMLGLAYLLRGSDPARSASLVSEAKRSEGLAEAVDFIKESLSAVSLGCASDMNQFLLEKGIG